METQTSADSQSLASGPLHCHWQGEGPALLLLHGWGMNGAVWQDLAPALAGLGFRVGQVDLPGFGHSRPLASGADLLAIAEAVATLLDDTPAHLLGWSLGGMVATQLALLQPERVASLVTLASSPRFQAEEGWPGIQPEVLAQFADQLQQDLPRTLDRFFALQAMGSASARDDVRTLRQAVAEKPQPHAGTLAEGLGLLARCDLRAQLGDLQLPWLRLYGRRDGLVPRRAVDKISALAPHSRAAVLTKAAHAPFVSHPEATLAELTAFYRDLT